jgi:transcriptional regulator with XRE-family HTH domain
MAQPVGPFFADLMRRLRAERGLSLRELARLTIHGKSYLHELETGSKSPTPQVAHRIDEALDAGGELVALASVQPGIHRREFVAAAGLAVALPHTLLADCREVSPDVPRQLTERAARLRRIDDYLGGADTYQVYAAEVESTTTLLQGGSYTEATGRALLAVLAEQAQMAGWAAFDAGRHGDAERLYRMSLAAAQDAEAPSLAGNAMAFLAYQELALGRSGVSTASEACETAGATATPGVRALLHIRNAWAHALNGQAADTERQLGIGATCLTEHDDRPEPDWVYWVDRTEVEIMTGRCWTVLHRPVRAIPILEQVLGVYDDTHARDKALYLSWLADAYLDANEIEQACVAAGRAMQLSAGVGSIRPGQRLDTFLGRLGPYATLPCVADLRALAIEWSRRRRLTDGAIPDKPLIPPRSQ